MLDVLKLYYSYFLFDFNVASTHNGHFATPTETGKGILRKKGSCVPTHFDRAFWLFYMISVLILTNGAWVLGLIRRTWSGRLLDSQLFWLRLEQPAGYITLLN